MRRASAGILLAILLGLLAVPRTSAQPAANQTTYFIDVGQGDAALIQDGCGFDVLIDGGAAAAGPTVTQFLKDHGAADLEIMLASHGDADHVGGLVAVLQDPAITTHSVLYNGYAHTTETWQRFVTAAADRGLTLTPVQFPSIQAWGGMTAYILNPASGLANPETNAASVVVRLDYGSRRELFTGDIDATIEATVVARLTPVASDILKVPHHGSDGSSSAAFLEAVHPSVAVISVGSNSYGHPSPTTISRLEVVGSSIYRTDQQGTILAVSDGMDYHVSPLDQVMIFLPLIN